MGRVQSSSQVGLNPPSSQISPAAALATLSPQTGTVQFFGRQYFLGVSYGM